MSFEADVQRLSQAALDFAERVLQAVVTEVGQPASSERLDELFELCSQALQYAILLESTLRKSLDVSFKPHIWKSDVNKCPTLN